MANTNIHRLPPTTPPRAIDRRHHALSSIQHILARNATSTKLHDQTDRAVSSSIIPSIVSEASSRTVTTSSPEKQSSQPMASPGVLSKDSPLSKDSNISEMVLARRPANNVSRPVATEENWPTSPPQTPTRRPNRDQQPRRTNKFAKAPPGRTREEAQEDDGDVFGGRGGVDIQSGQLELGTQWAHQDLMDLPRDENELIAKIEAWMERIPEATVPPARVLRKRVQAQSRNRTAQVDKDMWQYYKHPDSGKQHMVLTAEIAPRSWYDNTIDGEDMDTWWSRQLRLPDVDPASVPWWRRYWSPEADVLIALPAPDDLIDPRHSNVHLAAMTAEDRCPNRNRSKRLPGAGGPSTRERHIATIMNDAGVGLPKNDFSSRLNIFLRPAEIRDNQQIKNIYNHYVKYSVTVPDVEPILCQVMSERIADVKLAGLPFLVAVHRAKENKQGRRGRAMAPTRQPENGGETVVGFGFADDYGDPKGMYRYAVELEVYTDPDFVNNGVGRVLVDKLISILDTNYLAKGGYEFVPKATAPEIAHGTRVVGTIIVNMPFDKADEELHQKKHRFLTQFGFEEVGLLEDVGRKMGKAVSLATYSKSTGLTIAEWAA